jgi:hypothetical protein
MGTVTSASAVLLTGAWHSFEGIWWDACKVVGAVSIGLAVLAALFFAWAIWDDKRERTDVIVFGAMPVACPCCAGRPYESDDCTCRAECGAAWCQMNDPGAPLPVRKPPAFAEKRQAQPRHGCDDDTFVIDGLTTGLNELLRGEGRG